MGHMMAERGPQGLSQQAGLCRRTAVALETERLKVPPDCHKERSLSKLLRMA